MDQRIIYSNLHSRVSDITGEDFAKFLANVSFDTNSGCWNWLGAVSKSHGAYPQVQFTAIVNGKQFNGYGAHRLSYAIFKGPLIKGLDLDHTCRNIRCVAPSHLEQVAHKTNSQRAFNYTKGEAFLNGFLMGAA